MRSSIDDRRPFRRRRPVPGRALQPTADEPWPPHRVVQESERVFRRLQQLEARPWWRVSGRELDEIDARLDALRAHAGAQRT